MSDDDDDAPEEETPAGAPAWVMTFADLMSLLMCFFVLLLSFSVIDKVKFKTIIGSLEQAFGLQRDIRAESIPKGTSVIKREFTPGRPVPTTFDEIRQRTIEDLKKNLERNDARTKSQEQGQQNKESNESQKEGKTAQEDLTKEKVDLISAKLEKEIKDGQVEVDVDSRKIVIRISEKGTFSSGMAEIKRSFKPILEKINKVIIDVGGDVIVAGHTDNLRVSNSLFRSNWDLSALRAVSVIHELLLIGDIKADGISAAGFADTRPMAPNDTPENRAKNRRVEIIIEQGGTKSYQGSDISIINEQGPAEE